MAKPRGLRDIIGDAIDSQRPKRKQLPKKIRPPRVRPEAERRPRPSSKPKPSIRVPRPPFDRDDAILPKRPKPRVELLPSRKQLPKRKPKDVRPRKSAGNY